MDQSVGDIMTEGRNKAIKFLVLFASMAVYLAMLLYSGVHNWTLMTKGVPPDMLIWAALGVVALEVSAVFLPLGLHWWTHAALQRLIALGFYIVDLGLIILNVILDYSLVSGASIPGWMTMYLSYGVPATPIIAGLGWSLLWLLDPSQRERATVENLRASTREALAARIAEHARQADVSNLVDQAAQNLARQIVGQTLGSSALLPAKTPDKVVLPPAGSKYYMKKPKREPGEFDETEAFSIDDVDSVPYDVINTTPKNENEGISPNGRNPVGRGARLYRMDSGRTETEPFERD